MPKHSPSIAEPTNQAVDDIRELSIEDACEGRNSKTMAPALRLTFTGICSFIECSIDEGAVVKSGTPNEVRVLMLAAERLSLRPRLCPHTPLLIFKGIAPDFGGSYPDQPFWKTTITPGADPDPLCIWDISQLDLWMTFTKLSGDDATAPPLNFSPGATLDLRHYDGEVIDDYWLTSTLNTSDLIGSRFTLRSGTIVGTPPPANVSWDMINENGDKRGRAQFSGLMEVTVRRQDDLEVIHFFAKNPLGEIRNLSFRVPTDSQRTIEVAVSNLCGVRHNEAEYAAEDVKAFYDLQSTPLQEKLRFIPHPPELDADPTTPKSSACPPVVQFVS